MSKYLLPKYLLHSNDDPELDAVYDSEDELLEIVDDLDEETDKTEIVVYEVIAKYEVSSKARLELVDLE